MRPLTRFRRSFFSLALLAAMVAALLAGAPAATATTATPLGPRHYYLSLGDSFGFGLQLNRFFAMLDAGTYTPDAFNTGYTDDLAAMIRARLRPDLQVVNYSCPATATGAMLSADGCFFQQIGLALHDEFSGSQLDAATAFLRHIPARSARSRSPSAQPTWETRLRIATRHRCAWRAPAFFRRYARTWP
jgi:hypothetical protein